MKTGKNATIIMTLAVVFMMLVVPLSTLAGGGVSEFEVHNNSVLSADPEAIPEIPQYEIQYDPHNSVDGIVPAYFSLDSTVVQMAPSSWTAPTAGYVFNGWYVVDTSNSGYLSDAAGNPYRIMPGDGIKLIDSGSMSYDETNGVLSVPRPIDATQPVVVLEAQWDIPIIKYVKSGAGGSRNGSFDNPYAGINAALSYFNTHAEGTIFTKIIKIMNTGSTFEWGNFTAADVKIMGVSSDGLRAENVDLKIISNAIDFTNNEFYFDYVTLTKSNSINNPKNMEVSSRLILGENFKTTINTSNWYDSVNYGGTDNFNLVANGSTTHLVILGGTYNIVSGKGSYGGDSYICVGSKLSSTSTPKIFSVYGGYTNTANFNDSHILVNSGVIMEIVGGSRYGNSNSSNIEVAGGYVSYINGGPRDGRGVIGGGNGQTAVSISVLDGIIDYIYGGAKDGNNEVDSAPINGNVEIKVKGGDVYSISGGGYDFYNETNGHGVIGNIYILITGGQIGKNDKIFSGDSDPYDLGSKRSIDYFIKDPGIFGGGYRGSVNGNTEIIVGGVDNPTINGNIYGGGSGGIDESTGAGAVAKNDTTGKSYITGSTKVVIGESVIIGDVYGGGKGVEKSSYLRLNKGEGNLEVIVDATGMPDVATVYANSTVQIQSGANITGNIFGGGKGAKSVYINAVDGVLQSYLNGISDEDVKYLWEQHGNSISPKNFEYVSSADGSLITAATLNITPELVGKYIRLKIIAGNETILSNPVLINSTSSVTSLDMAIWNGWNKNSSLVANVQGTSTVNIFGGNVTGNVYGGGSYGIVGSPNIPSSTGGKTFVTINGGTIYGDVFGGGEGKFSTSPDDLDLGAVINSTEINISQKNGTQTMILGNVFGGGELAIVGIYDTDPQRGISQSPSVDYNSMNFTGGSTLVNISGGTISKNVYGGGEGSPNNIISGVVGDTQVIISGETTVLSKNVYGGGSYASVGDATVNLLGKHYVSGSSNNALAEVYILGGTIEGSVFGAGYGQQSFVSGKTNVVIGSGMAGITPSDVAIKGNVFGGGEMGSVGVTNPTSGEPYSTADNTTDISSNVRISPAEKQKITIGTIVGDKLKNGTGDVFGAGKGLSKSVFIDNGSNSTLNSYLYNMLDSSYAVVDYYSGVSTVDSYNWIVSPDDSSLTTTGSTLTLPADFTGTVQLAVTTSDNETFLSNTLSYANGSPNSTNLSKSNWEAQIREYVKIAQVAGSASVNISGGDILGSVFGGGSYGAVGVITDAEGKITNDPDNTSSKYYDPHYGESIYGYHEISGGKTSVTISGGTIGTLETIDGKSYTVAGTGNVFGGGMGEPATITAGSVGGSTTVNISEDLDKTTAIRGSIYGGGENGSVGNIVLSIDESQMRQIPATDGSLTNTYYFDLRVIGSSASDVDKIGYTKVNISGGTFAGQSQSKDSSNNIVTEELGNIFGGGYGLNASVIGFTNVNVTGGTMHNVYGGGELGIVGNIKFNIHDAIPKLTNGVTNVTITGSNDSKVIINGDVYGGGKGLDTDQIVEIILGAVGSATNVTINSNNTDNLQIHGSVYGGGELGIVGSYYLVWDNDPDDPTIEYVIFNGDLSTTTKLEYVNETPVETPFLSEDEIAELEAIKERGSNTYVTITGGTIWQNVYGGGKGKIGIDNLYSGAVGNTTVNIAGTATYNSVDDLVSPGTLIIGKSNLNPLDSRGLSTTSEVKSDTDPNSTYPSEQPVPGNVFVNVRNPEHGALIITNEAGDLQIPLFDREYDTYTFTPGNKYLITYEAKAELGYHVSTWYNVDNDDNHTITTAQFIVPNKNTTIWVDEDNQYYVNVVKPSFGRINTFGADGSEPTSEKIPGDSLSVKAYKLEYGTKLTLEYEDYSKDDVDSFVKVWTTTPIYEIIPSGDLSNADFTVGGDVRITVLQGPAIGNVYGGGAYGIVGSAQISYYYERGGIDYYEPHSSENNGKVIINITGGKIGTNDAGSLATGNVFGGGYGPSAYILGSTYINIGTYTDQEGERSIHSDIGILGNVFGGGEMGSVGYAASGNPEATGEKDKISTNISIKSDVKEHTIKIGSPIFGDNQKQFTDLWGNVYGGGQGGELPEKSVAGLDFNFDHGYAVVRGKTFISISGVETTTTPPYNVIIGGNVFGGGEGILKDDVKKGELDPYSFDYGKVTGVYDEDANKFKDATHIHLDKALVRKSVFGGGKLGIVGDVGGAVNYIKDPNNPNGELIPDIVGTGFIGKETRIYIDGRVAGNVFGGGEGYASNVIAGATGNTMVVIAESAKIGSLDPLTNKPTSVVGDEGLIITSGNVYGGGRIAITGDFAVYDDTLSELAPHENDNTSKTIIAVLGGEILNSVYGGGFSPKATIAGSTEVYIGSNDFNNSIYANFTFINKREAPSVSAIHIHGDVFGGGEMGAVGTTVLEKEGSDGQLDTDFYVDANSKKWVSTSVFITSNNVDITIDGSVFGGGKGIVNTELNGIMGYAVVRGNTNVQIIGDTNDASKITIYKVYGGGQGVQGDVYSVFYGEVYDSTSVTISDATIKDSVYGGGDLGLIGHFTDSYPTTGSTIKFLQNNKVVTGTVTETNRFDENGAPLYELNYNDEKGTSQTMITTITIREFCGDDAQQTDGGYGYGPKAYKGLGTTTVAITDSQIGGSVYGGGRGVEISVLAGAVGRGTTVTIEDTSCNDTVDPNHKTMIAGSVYGGGKLGIVGSVTTQIIGTALFSQVKIIHAAHVNDLKNFTLASANLDKQNDIESIVNIFGGRIKGSVFGAGKGEELRIEGADYGDAANAYYKLSVFGRTEVNITNGVIDKHVFGGSEEGDTGSFTVLQYFQKFTDWYWKQVGMPFAHPSNIPVEERDEFYKQYVTEQSSMPTFSASFVNVVGGTIYGNVFGGGYFGASHGNVHVHIGWNAVMPYTGTTGYEKLGDCHYYNDYSGINSDDHNFVKKNKYLTETGPSSNLIINGSVYAGSDRGDPNATEINYDYISIYGTAHILINGTGYATGIDEVSPGAQDIVGNNVSYAMAIHGSIFGSGNSCSTFFTDKEMSRFIYITNYCADELSKYVVYSIQRATEVNLINSVIRLPGRSNGANVDKTALYSLNHINKLTLQSTNYGSSKLILETVVNDLRAISSENYDGTTGKYVATTTVNPYNTIQLNNGISLIIRTQISNSLTLTGENTPMETAVVYTEGQFGPVSGFFYLDVKDSNIYSSYVYGQRQKSADPNDATGGFVSKNLSGVEEVIKFTDSSTNYDTWKTDGYRVWMPAGGGNMAVSSTVVAKAEYNGGNQPNNVTDGIYTNKGRIYLPLTTEGAQYNIIGYTINPAQTSNLAGDEPSLTLLSKDLPFTADLDANKYFKLGLQAGSGFEYAGTGEAPILWLDNAGTLPDIDLQDFTASGHGTLPEVDVILESSGVTATVTAGTVVILVQEQLPKTGADGNISFEPGNKITITLTIETQAEGLGEKDPKDPTNYLNEMDLYATQSGSNSWNFTLSGNNKKYEFTLDSVTLNDNSITLVTDPSAINNNNDYMLTMSPSLNTDNSNGWDGQSFTQFALTPGSSLDRTLGQTDGRFNTSFNFTLTNKAQNDTYPEGQLKVVIGYENLSAPVDEPEKGTVTLAINLKELVNKYVVDFQPSPGESGVTGAIIHQDIVEGSTVTEPTTPTYLNNKYTFAGWYSDTALTNKYDFDTPVDHSFTLYGKWISQVTFDAGDGSFADGNKTVVIPLESKEGLVSPSADPTRTGYLFGGWYTDTTGTTAFDFENTEITENTTLYAKWAEYQYYIEYNVNTPAGIVNSSGQPSNTPTISASGPYLSSATITLNDELNSFVYYLSDNLDKQYKFGGWTTAGSTLYAGGSSLEVSQLIDQNTTYDESSGQATITLKAFWLESTMHTVTVSIDPAYAKDYITLEYLSNTNSEYQSISGSHFQVAENEEITIRYAIKEGGYSSDIYTNPSWNVNAVASSTNDSCTIKVDSDKSVTLTLTAKQIDVTVNGNGGTVTYDTATNSTCTIPVNFGESFSAYLTKITPSRLGWNFTGWFTEANSTNSFNASAPIETEQTIYAGWSAKTYALQFVNTQAAAIAGDPNSIQQFTYNPTSGKMTLEFISPNFTASGKILAGWSDTDSGTKNYDLDGSIKITDSLIEAADTNGTQIVKILYSVWDEAKLTVTLSKGEETFDGKSWYDRISLTSPTAAVTINVEFNGSNITSKITSADLSWVTSNNTPVNNINGMINADTYTLTVKYTDEDHGLVSGSATFTILPCTDNLSIITKDLIYQGSNLQLSDIISSVSLGNEVGYEILQTDLDAYFTVAYYSDPEFTIPDTEFYNVGTHYLKLTAKPGSTNYYSSADSKGADGSQPYTIIPLAITITPDAKQWKYYGDDLNHIYTGDSATPNQKGIECSITAKHDGSTDEPFTPGTNGYDLINIELKLKDVPNIQFAKASTYSIIGSELLANPNYNITFNETITFEVKKLLITITPTEKQWKFYGDIDKIFIGDYSPHATSSTSIQYTIAAQMNGKSIIDMSLDAWNSEYCPDGYEQLSNIEVSYEGAKRFIDKGEYEFRLVLTDGANPNYEIKLVESADKFKVKPLPIFIAPWEGQWKYYGYDLTNLDNFGKDGDDLAYIFIGEGTTEKLSSLNYDIYDFRSYDEGSVKPIKPTDGYKPLEGRLTSDMLFGDSSVHDATGYTQELYDITTEEIRTNSNNGNYEIYSYDNPYSKTANITLGAKLGAETSTALPNKPAAKIEQKPASLIWSTSFTYNGKDQKNNISAQYEDKDGKTQQISNDKISVTLGEDPKITTFLVSGSYAVSADVSDLTNYDFGTTNSTSITMAEANLEITINNLDVTYNGNNSFTFSSKSISSKLIPTEITSNVLDGLGDTITEITIKTTGKDVGPYSNIELVNVKVENNRDDGNTKDRSNCYIATVKAGALTIKKATITITPTSGQSITYGEAMPTLTYTYSGQVTGETPVFSGSLAYNGTDAGTYTIELGTLALTDGSGFTAKNYQLALDSTPVTFEIKKATITITVNTSKTYDGNVWSKNFSEETFSGLVPGDSITQGTLSTTSTAIDTYKFSGSAVEYDNIINEDFEWSIGLETAYGINNYSIIYDLSVIIVEEEIHTVSFDSNGGSSVSDQHVVNGGLIEKPADPTKHNYKFVGWYKDADLKEEWDFENDIVIEDIILYAKWQADDSPNPPTYKVQYDANGGLGNLPQDNHRYRYGEHVTVLEGDLSKAGYVFQGWCDEVSGKLYNAGDVFNMPNRDVCLKANWTLDGSLPENQATVIFCVDDEEYAQVIVSKGTALDGRMPSDPIKEGFDFAGWYVGEEEFTSSTIVNGNLTVYAKWTLNEDYVIVYFVIDNELYLTKVCKKDNITEPNIQHSQNKQINGWYVDPDLQNKFDFNTVVTTSHLTLYAEWQDNTNLMIWSVFLIFAVMIAAVIASTKRLSFYENKNDEEKYESVLMIGSGVIGDKLPTMNNDNFLGWYTEQGEQITAETKITQSMKVYARWKE